MNLISKYNQPQPAPGRAFVDMKGATVIPGLQVVMKQPYCNIWIYEFIYLCIEMYMYASTYAGIYCSKET